MMIRSLFGVTVLLLYGVTSIANTGITLIQPKNNSVVSNVSVYFQWNVLPAALNYKLQIATENTFQTIVDSAITSNNDTNLSSLAFGQTYYWRVLVDTGGSVYVNLSNQHQFTLFIPSNLSSLQLWLNPDTGITKGLNDSVSNWVDVYSSNISFAQTDISQQPIWVDSALNNFPVVRFDGTDDFLTAGDTLDLKFNSRSIFMLGKSNAPNNSCYMAKSIYANVPNRFGILYFPSNNNLFFQHHDAVSQAISISQIAGNYEIITGRINRINQQCTVYINSDSLGWLSGIQDGSYNFISNYRFLLGAYNDATDAGETLHLDGDIAEIIIYDTALNDSSRGLVEQYLRQKYYPPVCLGEDILIGYGFCNVTIEADTVFSSYLWNTGDTTTSVSVSVPGTYSVTVWDLFGYTSTDTIKVKHLFNQLKNTTICLGDTIIWDTGLDTLGYDFAWSTGGTDSILIVTQAGAYAVTVTDTLGAGCSFESDTMTLLIDTFSLIPNLGSADTSFCAGNTIGLIYGDSLVASYLWSPSGEMTPTINVFVSDTHSVILTNTNECIAYDTIRVTINGIAPVAGFNVDTVCTGDSTTFIDTSVTADTLISWLWNFGDGNTDTMPNPVHKYDTAGIYNVTLTVTTNLGCDGIITRFVLVRQNAKSYFISDAIGCVGNAVDFYDSSIAASGDTIIAWNWDFGDGMGFSADTNPTYTYLSDSVYAVTLVVTTAKGCSHDTVLSINVVSTSTTPASMSLICPMPAQILVDSSMFFWWNASFNSISYKLEIASDMGMNIIWYSFNGITGTSYLAQSPLPIGTYYWRVTSFNICNDSTFSNVQKFQTLNPTVVGGLNFWLEPSMGVTKSTMDSVNVWADVQISGISFTPPSPLKRPLWIDSALNSRPLISFDGTDDVLSAGDTLDLGTSSRTIFILGRSKNSTGTYFAKSIWGSDPKRYALLYYPAADTTLLFNYHDATVKSFYVNRAFGKFEILAYRVDRLSQKGTIYVNSNSLDSISGIQDASYDFNSNFRFLLGAYNDPVDIGEILHLNGEIAEVIIYNSALNNEDRSLIEQYLRHKYSPPICLGADLILDGFCGATISADTVYTSYIWSTNETTQSITITQPGTYSVTVTDIFDYTSSDTLEVFYPGNLGAFNDTTICLYDTITWNTQLDTASYTFQWSDTTATSPSLNITQAGAYYVIIIDDSNCFYYSDTINVAIDSFAVLMYLGTDGDTLCAGNSIGLVQGAAQAASYQWACGSTATTPAIQVNITDTFCVTVTDTLGCQATDSIYVVVKGIAPLVSFSADTTCFGNGTQFTDGSSATFPDSIASWDWDFGDTNTSNAMNPAHLYGNVGTYQVLLTVTTDSGCSDTSIVMYTVHPNPQAGFDPLNVCSNTPVTFNDLSTVPGDSITNWIWYFESDTLFSQNPGYSFLNSGTTGVTQIVSSVFGCADTITQSVSVVPSPVPGFTAALLCGSNSVIFNDTSIIQSPYSLLALNWDFGDASTSSLPSLVHDYTDTGTYIVTLTIQSISGCSATVSDTIRVVLITVNADFTNLDPCYQQAYQYMDNSIVSGDSILTWEWSFNNMSFAPEPDPYYTFNDSGSFPVSLTITSTFGCMDSITKNVTVHNPPNANFDFSPKFGLKPGENIEFTNLTTGGVSYFWDFGDNTNSVLDTPTHAYVDTGIYQIVLYAFTSFNCSDSIVKTLDVRQPKLDVDLNAVNVDCQPTIIQNITLTLINRGTREVTSLDIFIRIDGGDPIREQWTGFLAPGEPMSYTFNVDFPVSGSIAVNYVCAWIGNPNGLTDEVEANNEKCVACRNEFVIIEPFPNPSSGTINFWFILPQADFIEASIYDARGAYIGQVISQQANKGLNRLTVNTKAFTMRKGVYAIKFTYLDKNYIKSFVIL